VLRWMRQIGLNRMHLATIRQAGRLTQEDIARTLGRAQPAMRAGLSPGCLGGSIL
jgi:hypothetical protein